MKTRSDVVIRRTYARPLNEEETRYESWEDICLRVKDHQRWLWERALGKQELVEQEFNDPWYAGDPKDAPKPQIRQVSVFKPGVLSNTQEKELDDFYQLMLDKKCSVSGRSLWLGGTDLSKVRESSMFNCSGIVVETVYDMVDVLWLLMQGCGVGFKPKVGTLNGFFKPIKDIEVIRTKRTAKGGLENNVETFINGIWTIKIGDSAEAWSKSIGKILAGKYPADKLVFDFSELRPAGSRLKGYGWISSGDEAISKAFVAIANIMNKKAGELLSRIDILDIVNWLGTILSSRRSAQIALFEYDQPEWEEFAVAKRGFWNGNSQRSQSNNSLVFYTKPSKKDLQNIFDMMQEAGGSEPGFINGATALTRAPWFNTVNPCCFTGDMKLLTIDGYKSFKELEGKSFKILNDLNEEVSSTVIKIVDKSVIEIIFKEQEETIKCTKDHLFKLFEDKDTFAKAEDLLNRKVKTHLKNNTEYLTVTYIKELGSEEVYDFSILDNEYRLGVVESIVVHNCEILLGNKGFCNLVEIDISKFIGDTSGLLKTIYLTARANYRQTLVNLKDGVLQEAWHLNNEFLRLCGVGLTGIAQRPDLSEYDLETMKREAISAAYSMADELGLQRPKNITCVKPSGTLSKVMECTEGLHTPLGKYIFNNINFGLHDPLLPALKDAGYKVWNNPLDLEGVLVTFPIKWENVPFTKVKTSHGIVEVNQESAIEQLERYKKYQVHWCQQNVSCTISYEPKEVKDIINWLLANWDIYVGVSFLYKADPTKTAQDLGYAYLPQEVVTKEMYEEYVSTLKEFVLPNLDSNDNEIDPGECISGVCPIK